MTGTVWKLKHLQISSLLCWHLIPTRVPQQQSVCSIPGWTHEDNMAGQILIPHQYYLYLLVHCGLWPHYQICFLACQVESTFPEEELSISLSPITNGNNGTLGDDSEVSHFSSLTRYLRFGMWINILCVLKFVGHQWKWQFSIPWYRVVLYKCNIFVDNVIIQ